MSSKRKGDYTDKEYAPKKTKSESIGRRSNVLLVGSGEYTTGYVGGGGTKSDKGCGVVGLVHFDLRKRKKIGNRVAICGTNGTKFPAIRQHLKTLIDDRYSELSSEFDSFPADDVKRDTLSYEKALDTFSKGDIVAIFTPDDTHYNIALAAIKRGMHVIVAKPFTKTLLHHRSLSEAAEKYGVLAVVEVHKRYDPIYNDARNQIQTLGDFNYFVSYMSQPKFQLETFASWAGKSSDISYYLNSHHVDFHCWSMSNIALPIRLSACASTGVAKAVIGVDTEDTITLTVQWKNLKSGNLGTAVYTASWSAPVADVHSQQRFYYQAEKGEVQADQAHRGYTISTDSHGFKNVNPLYMRYTPGPKGQFMGQSGYGYQSFETFIDAVNEVNGGVSPSYFDDILPTVSSTVLSTAILEAGRRSLDNGGAFVKFVYDGGFVVDLIVA